ncbi:MAG TPA: methyltransferase domain-containing protein [Blastocatellia bacterium]
MATEGNGSTGETVAWPSLQKALVDDLIARDCINDARVEAAFRAVPRHLFLPGVPVDQAYKDAAITTKQEGDKPISSGSQPAVVAMMLEQLGLQPGQRVLEIGAGTGYNAALMAQIIGSKGAVDTVDIDEDIVEQARKNLAAAGVQGVHAVCDDGGFGYPPGAPYDRIILTVGTGAHRPWQMA